MYVVFVREDEVCRLTFTNVHRALVAEKPRDARADNDHDKGDVGDHESELMTPVGHIGDE